MKTNYLLPNKYKTFGWVLLSLGIMGALLIKFSAYNFINEPEFLNFKVLNFFDPGDPFHPEKKTFFKIIEKNIAPEIALLSLIIGGLIVSFTKEKIEDEFITKLRFDSMIWAIVVNYTILILTIISIYGMNFFYVMGLNILTPLIFFIIRFNFLKYKSRSHEE